MDTASQKKSGSAWISRLTVLAVVLAIGGIAWGTSNRWLPRTRAWLAAKIALPQERAEAAGHDEHAGHSHDHEGHEEASSIELSAQARKNIGLEVAEAKLQSFDRAIAIPSMVVERPGHTMIKVAAPITGVVTAVYPLTGEAVASGSLLFRLRLTHEDLVQSQTNFLRTLGQLDVEEKEIARLEKLTEGAVAGKVVLERKYERGKLEAALRAEREALLLHGLTTAQIDAIERGRKLFREMDIFAPLVHEDSSLHDESEVRRAEEVVAGAAYRPEGEASQMMRRFVVGDLPARRGQVVQAGDPLCTLGDFTELYIEGRAFEQDAEALVKAANYGRKVTAVLEGAGTSSRMLEGLEFSHVANEVEADSRALHFYIRLPNDIARDSTDSEGRHFLTWKYKLGQRMQVRVPIETWKAVFVLPVDAVAQEGPESFVFVENGDQFDRKPVHVVYRDQVDAVIANDGSIYPGNSIAMNCAHQLQMAIKNKAGGAPDPHAGHHH